MKKIAYMFPGQGSQGVGMGEDFYKTEEIKELYNQEHNALGKDINTLMFEGPTEELTETENAHPAVLLSSVVVYKLLEQAGVKPAMAVGHSLGYYSAFGAGNSIKLDEALALVATRGKLMAKAVPKGEGTKAAVIGLNQEQ